jgi:hypothetical protein
MKKTAPKLAICQKIRAAVFFKSIWRACVAALVALLHCRILPTSTYIVSRFETDYAA